MTNKDPRITVLDTVEVPAPLKMLPQAQALLARRGSARRYIFDPQASYRVGEILRDCIDLVVDNIEFARAPYETTYIQTDAQEVWRGWMPENPVSPTSDQQIGYLIHDNSVLVLAGRLDRSFDRVKLPMCVPGGMMFRINRPQRLPFAKLCGYDSYDPPMPTGTLSQLVKQAYVFGGRRITKDGRGFSYDSTFEFDDKMAVYLPPLPGAWSHEQIAAHFDVSPTFPVFDKQQFVEMAFLGGGDPIMLSAALLLLNQPSKYLSLIDVEPRRGIYKGALKSFKGHRVVTIHLDRDQHVRRLLTHTDRASPIGHPVAGHWKHYNKSDGCSHHHEDGRQAWEPVGLGRTSAGDYKRYWCPLCLRRRTWVDQFQRGDAARGYTIHDYDVKP